MSPAPPAVALILLAAGESRRLGSPKQLLPYRGRPLLRHAAETALASACRPVVVVLGAQAETIRPALDGLNVRVAVNDSWAAGMGTSIAAGMQVLAGEALDGVVLMVCDQPLVTADLLGRLVDEFASSGRPIVASVYGGSAGVPALFARALFEELVGLREAGAKRVIAARPERVAEVPFPDGAVDVDTPEDAARYASGA